MEIVNDIDFERCARLYLKKKCFARIPDGFSVTRATTIGELRDAFKLVYEAYIEKGYINGNKYKIRLRAFDILPEMSTFIAKNEKGEVIGTLSLLVDSEFGLPSDTVFGGEIEAFRKGRLIGEVTNLALAKEYRNAGLFAELARCVYAEAIYKKCDGLIAVISPAHVSFHQIIGFEKAGIIKSSSAEVQDPVAYVQLKFEGNAKWLKEKDVLLKENAFLYDYFYANNPYYFKMSAWEEKAKNIYEDIEAFKELFFKQGGLTGKHSERELELILIKCKAAKPLLQHTYN